MGAPCGVVSGFCSAEEYRVYMRVHLHGSDGKCIGTCGRTILTGSS